MYAIYLVCVIKVINHRCLVKEYFAILHIKNSVRSGALLPHHHTKSKELFCTHPMPPSPVTIDHHRHAASCLIFLGFELRHSLLSGFHCFAVYAHQLKEYQSKTG
jgi:hypothetical protein